MPIGVFDSGLGGLTILGALTRALPEQDFVYLGDNANAPYGWRSPAEIYELTIAGVERLFAAGCGLVILACNTASAVALHDLQVNWLDPTTHRVLGVFVPVIEHLTRRDWGDNAPPTHTGLRDVALFATPATVRERRLSARAALPRPRRGGGAAGLRRARRGDRGRRSRPRRRRWRASTWRRCSRGCPRRSRRCSAARTIRWSRPRSARRCRRGRRWSRSRRWSPTASPTISAPPAVSRRDRARSRYLTTGDPVAVGARAAVFTGAPLPFRRR